MYRNIDLLWSEPKIFIAKKKFNNKLISWIGSSYKWYVYYYYLNPKTQKFKKEKVYGNLNEIYNTGERKYWAKVLQIAVTKFLEEGYSPFEPRNEPIICNSLWSKPKIIIPAKYKHKELIPSENCDWYISYYFFNSKTQKLDFFKEKYSNSENKNLNARILYLKSERDLIENKLSNGFNPFDETETQKIKKKTNKIAINENIYLKELKENNKLKSNYPFIFKNILTEKIFYNFLLKQNIIDEKKNIIKIKKLSAISHAFYNVSIDNSNKDKNVLKDNVDKQDFRNFINKEFRKKYKRFSNSSSYESQAQDFYNKDSNFI